MTHKVCVRCRLNKRVDNFVRSRATKDGWSRLCRSCERAQRGGACAPTLWSARFKMECRMPSNNSMEDVDSIPETVAEIDSTAGHDAGENRGGTEQAPERENEEKGNGGPEEIAGFGEGV